MEAALAKQSRRSRIQEESTKPKVLRCRCTTARGGDKSGGDITGGGDICPGGRSQVRGDDTSGGGNIYPGGDILTCNLTGDGKGDKLIGAPSKKECSANDPADFSVVCFLALYDLLGCFWPKKNQINFVCLSGRSTMGEQTTQGAPNRSADAGSKLQTECSHLDRKNSQVVSDMRTSILSECCVLQADPFFVQSMIPAVSPCMQSESRKKIHVPNSTEFSRIFFFKFWIHLAEMFLPPHAPVFLSF